MNFSSQTPVTGWDLVISLTLYQSWEWPCGMMYSGVNKSLFVISIFRLQTWDPTTQTLYQWVSYESYIFMVKKSNTLITSFRRSLWLSNIGSRPSWLLLSRLAFRTSFWETLLVGFCQITFRGLEQKLPMFLFQKVFIVIFTNEI